MTQARNVLYLCFFSLCPDSLVCLRFGHNINSQGSDLLYFAGLRIYYSMCECVGLSFALFPVPWREVEALPLGPP